MRERIQKLIDQFRLKGWESKPYDLACEIMDGQSEDALLLVDMALDQLPKPGNFFDEAISFVPEAELPRLAEKAMARLRESGTAESFLAHCSLQQVQALHPFLDELWKQAPNGSTYYADWPWRASGTRHFDFLKSLLADEDDGPEAWDRLLETRHPEILKYCAEHVPSYRELYWNNEFLDVGFDLPGGRPRQLYPERVWHMVFPEDYFSQSEPAHLKKHHPTWTGRSMEADVTCRLGGKGSHICAACGAQGHLIISLPKIPSSLPMTGIERANFETCCSCLGWEAPRLFYRHGQGGEVSPVGYERNRIVPQFPAKPFAGTEVRLMRTPPRWQWQDWGVTNGRQNLHRLGGYPCWIQHPEYLACPVCKERMSFLLQVDSFLPTEARTETLWGSGGICYVHWCDRCKVSGWMWQCT